MCSGTEAKGRRVSLKVKAEVSQTAGHIFSCSHSWQKQQHQNTHQIHIHHMSTRCVVSTSSRKEKWFQLICVVTESLLATKVSQWRGKYCYIFKSTVCYGQKWLKNFWVITLFTIKSIGGEKTWNCFKDKFLFCSQRRTTYLMWYQRMFVILPFLMDESNFRDLFLLKCTGWKHMWASRVNGNVTDIISTAPLICQPLRLLPCSP